MDPIPLKKKKHSEDDKNEEQKSESVFVNFVNAGGEELANEFSIKKDENRESLNTLINKVLGNEEKRPYSFYVEGFEVTSTLKEALERTSYKSENVIKIQYNPEAIFEVKPLTRATSTLECHLGEILCIAFSPDGQTMASGSGDSTVRLWDITTETPMAKCEGHKGWVLCLAWSPDCNLLASGSMDNKICIWEPNGKLRGKLSGHSKWVTSIAWEPIHLRAPCVRLVSSSKDSTVRIWNILSLSVEVTISVHTDTVTKVLWGGTGLIYSGSHDRTVKVWNDKGKLVRSLDGHAHWVNTLALSTEHILRTGSYDYTNQKFKNAEEMKVYAGKRYKEALLAGGPNNHEKLVSGSDDFTMIMWDPTHSKKAICRMTGHQQLINHAAFSPSGLILASASFDKSIKLWNGLNGKYIGSLRGHVGSVYQVISISF
jgi:ribosome assembly protein 4